MEEAKPTTTQSAFDGVIELENKFMILRHMMDNGSDYDKVAAKRALEVLNKAASVALRVELSKDIVNMYRIVEDPKSFVRFLENLLKWKNVKIEDVPTLTIMLDLAFSNKEMDTLLEIRKNVRGYVLRA